MVNLITHERRAEERVSIGDGHHSALAFLFWHAARSDEKNIGMAFNISKRGIGFTHKWKMEKNDPVTLKVLVPKKDVHEFKTQRPVVLHGEVRWCRQGSDGKYVSGVKLDVQSSIENAGAICEITQYSTKNW